MGWELDQMDAMPLWAQMLIAGVAAVGFIAAGKAIITGFAISRRRSHHLARQTDAPTRAPNDTLPPAGW